MSAMSGGAGKVRGSNALGVFSFSFGLFISIVMNQVNLVFLFLNDVKLPGIFLPFLVSFCYFALGQQWMEVVNILEVVISLLLSGCLDLELCEVTNSIF